MTDNGARDNVVQWADPDDDLAQLLRSELAREAASINPADRFAEVLAATEQADQRRSPWRWAGVAAVLLLLAGVVTPFLLTRSPTNAPATRPSVVAPSKPANSVSLPTQQLQLPVYFVNSQNHLFYQENRDLPTLDNPLMTAVNAVLNVAPNNPQYASLWKGGTVISAAVKNNVVHVNLTTDSYTPLKDKITATNAAFQIYYTVNAVLSDGLNPIDVVLEADGSSDVPLLGDTSKSDFWMNAPSLGPVYIDSPQSGTTVSAGNLTMTGYILSGNSAPKVTIARADGSHATTSTATLGGTIGQWQSWSLPLTLAKGDYQATVTSLDTTNTVLFTVS